MDAALLIGNGLNRSLENHSQNLGISWKDLMQDIEREKGVAFHENNSFPLEFECMVNEICGNTGKTCRDVIADLKENYIARKIQKLSPVPGCVHEDFMRLPVADVMTTNYDYVLETVIQPGFKRDVKNYANTIRYSHRRRNTENDRNIWHIHGEIAHPETICLGFDHYTGYLHTLRDYLKREVSIEAGLSQGLLPRTGQLPKADKNGKYHNFGESWMELFFTHDIHIVGLSLDVCEIDLWWLLTYRAKLISSDPLMKEHIQNRIYFYTTNPAGQGDSPTVSLFRRLHVECINEPRTGSDFESAYRNIATRIAQTVEDRKHMG